VDADGNEWLFVTITSDVLTVLCSKHEPMDVKLLGTGKLQLNPMCKVYGKMILIQSHATIVSNRTNKDIPPMSLEYDCCSIDKNFKLNELRLHTPLRSVAGSLDDFRIASHKVEDVEKLILEQEWKVKHSTLVLHLFFVFCRHGDDWFNFMLLLLFEMLPQTMPEIFKMVEG